MDLGRLAKPYPSAAPQTNFQPEHSISSNRTDLGEQAPPNKSGLVVIVCSGVYVKCVPAFGLQFSSNYLRTLSKSRKSLRSFETEVRPEGKGAENSGGSGEEKNRKAGVYKEDQFGSGLDREKFTKMAPINFDLPLKSRLPKIIGVINHQLYVFVRDAKSLDIWSSNLYIPHSWKRKWHFEFEEVAYSTATTMVQELCIYLMFTGTHLGEEHYSLDILRLNIDDQEYVRYKSADAVSVFELAELYGFHFETDTLCAGEHDLYIYDRGIVSGEIPFTRFTLNHEQKTFTGTREPIPVDESHIHPVTFGSLICPDQKQFVKLADHNSLRLFDQDLNKWIEYTQPREDNDLYLNELITRHVGIGITYNQEHTRFALVSSPLKLVAGDGECILVYKYTKRVLFCRIIFDHDSHEFRLKKIDLIKHSIAQGYMSCDSHHLIILSRPSYFIPLKLLTLKELAFKAAQKLVGPNATDDSKIRELCGLKHQSSLI